MKQLLTLIATILIFASCKDNSVRFNTGNEKRFDEIENRVDVIEDKLDQLFYQMDIIGYKLNSLQSDFAHKLEDVYYELKKEINLHNTSVSSQIKELEEVIDGLNDDTLTIIDPCKEDNFNEEILLKKGSGELIALYYTGSKAFLTKLKDGNYITTDFRKCRFTVKDGNVL